MADSTRIFHDTFEKLFEEQRWTQRSLARAAGLSQGLVGKYLNRKTTPSLANLDALAGAMKVSPSNFVLGEAPAGRRPAEPTTTDLLAEIRALRASSAPEPWLADFVVLLREIDDTKRAEVLSWLRRYVAASKPTKVIKKDRNAR